MISLLHVIDLSLLLSTSSRLHVKIIMLCLLLFHLTLQMTGTDDLYVKYSFNYGVDWTVMHGLEHGISQVARQTAGRAGQTFAWNYPVDISFKSTNVFGWPQIVLTVYSISLTGKDIVKGYGSVHIPTTPGRHVRYVRLYTPVSSSLCQRFTAWITGNPPEYFNSKFIAQGKGTFPTWVLHVFKYSAPVPRVKSDVYSYW